ncbi:zinc ribbon domain-containing protein [Clostridium sp. SYSU_GA19001]|uniref:zinc ribbon domain-containing protein n=1 Tax=Clostridium caldaquaticum TaxID=2940653 RepID=UPI0020776884|nr:zinc ribbon domain-containing protein [Clostridium caldaquaticum]MCM8711785.1 zinc ribbon domain-containing protein [Clostridium caldaquaticum]
MNLFVFIIYIFVLSLIFSYLDKKYKLAAKYELKVSKKVRVLVNIVSIALFVALMYLSEHEEYITSLWLKVFQGIIFVPVAFRFYIYSVVSQIKRIEEEKRKKRDIEIKFCYYCGSGLNEGNICPNCGKELEM